MTDLRLTGPAGHLVAARGAAEAAGRATLAGFIRGLFSVS
jgi:hypothetical protein